MVWSLDFFTMQSRLKGIPYRTLVFHATRTPLREGRSHQSFHPLLIPISLVQEALTGICQRPHCTTAAGFDSA
jgi:hypothetical protein